MAETTALASGDAEASAHPGIVSVHTYPAKTLPGTSPVVKAGSSS